MDDIYKGALAESGGDRLHDSGGMTKGGLVTYYVLFVMDLANRQVACSGITPHPDATWMLQVGRNQTDAFSGFCSSNGISSWTGSARSTPPFGGRLKVPAVARSAYRHSRLTATRTWSDSMSHPREAADRTILIGEEHLRSVVADYLEYYHRERNHQGLDGGIIQPPLEVGAANGGVRRGQRLGGMLNSCHRDAA